MKHFNQIIEAQLEAQRAIAAYAARPTLDGKARATMLFHCMEAAKQAGKIETARAYAMELRPIAHLLED